MPRCRADASETGTTQMPYSFSATRVPRAAAAACVLALASLAPHVADAADDAAGLLALHRAYAGWQLDDGTFATLKVRETISMAQKDGTQKEIVAAQDVRRGLVHHRSYFFAGGLRHDEGFTGRTFWAANENGFTVPRHDSRRDIELATLAFFAEGMTTMKPVSVKRDVLDGAQIAIVRVAMPFDLLVDLYEDPASGAFLRVVFDPVKRAETLIVDGYDEIKPGKRMVTRWHFATSKTREVDVVTANPPVTNDDLKPPASRAEWTFGTSQPFHVEVNESSVVVDATVNGVRGRFFLDTGASGIAVTPEFAARAKLHAIADTEFAGLTGRGRGTIATADSIAFADGSTLHNVTVTTGLVPLGQNVSGLLGFDFLAGAIVDVNLDAQSLTLFDPAKVAANDAGTVVVSPDLTSGVPYVPAVLNGARDVRAMLDLGNRAPVLFAYSLHKDIVLATGSEDRQEVELSGAGGGLRSIQCGLLDKIQFGSLSYVDAHACYLDEWPVDEALVGFDFLHNFNFTFDYPDGKILMTQRKH